MIKRERFNELLKIKENYEMPERVMKILFDDKEKEKIFDELTAQESDMQKDFFTELFQEEHGDRNALKQDFTPDCLCDLMSRISGTALEFADICAGTGGLTIKKWKGKENTVYCEEVSGRTIPMLLLNLSIRNMQGLVVHGNSLTEQIEAVYKLERGAKYSTIMYQLPIRQTELYPTVIMNPPYSLKWEEVTNYAQDIRFKEFGLPPKKAADYAFVMHGLARLKRNGELFAILPHGVLFRGQAEEQIRIKLIKSNLIHAVIGLPDKMFMNTSIPVCILVLKKDRSENGILFIDASKEFEKCAKQNVMKQEHLERIVSVYQNWRTEKKFSKVVSMQEIEENGYNLNIPRYVDTFEHIPAPDARKTLLKIREIEKEIKESERTLFASLSEMYGTTMQEEQAHKELIDVFRENLEAKYGKNIIDKQATSTNSEA